MRVLFFFLVMSCSLVVRAQYYYDRNKNPDKVVTTTPGRDFDKYFFFSWDGNTPLSNPNYINQTSTLGTKLGFRKRLNSVDNLWVGLEAGWSVYNQHLPYNTYQIGSAAVSAELFNYSYNYSLSGNIDYYFFSMEKIVVPYGGLGIGVAYDKFAQYYNIYEAATESFGVLVKPEIGVLIGFKENSSWRIKAAVHFDYASNAGNLLDNGFITVGNNNYNGFANMGLQIGIVKMAW